MSNVNLGAEAKPFENHTPKPKYCMCTLENPVLFTDVVMLSILERNDNDTTSLPMPPNPLFLILGICMNGRRSLTSIKWKNSHEEVELLHVFGQHDFCGYLVI